MVTLASISTENAAAPHRPRKPRRLNATTFELSVEVNRNSFLPLPGTVSVLGGGIYWKCAVEWLREHASRGCGDVVHRLTLLGVAASRPFRGLHSLLMPMYKTFPPSVFVVCYQPYPDNGKLDSLRDKGETHMDLWR